MPRAGSRTPPPARPRAARAAGSRRSRMRAWRRPSPRCRRRAGARSRAARTPQAGRASPAGRTGRRDAGREARAARTRARTAAPASTPARPRTPPPASPSAPPTPGRPRACASPLAQTHGPPSGLSSRAVEIGVGAWTPTSYVRTRAIVANGSSLSSRHTVSDQEREPRPLLDVAGRRDLCIQAGQRVELEHSQPGPQRTPRQLGRQADPASTLDFSPWTSREW